MQHLKALVIKHTTTQNQQKLPKTSQDQPQHPQPTKTSQNYPKLAELSKNHTNKQWFQAVFHL